jgi:hypothetical protein
MLNIVKNKTVISTHNLIPLPKRVTPPSRDNPTRIRIGGAKHWSGAQKRLIPLSPTLRTFSPNTQRQRKVGVLDNLLNNDIFPLEESQKPKKAAKENLTRIEKINAKRARRGLEPIPEIPVGFKRKEYLNLLEKEARQERRFDINEEKKQRIADRREANRERKRSYNKENPKVTISDPTQDPDNEKSKFSDSPFYDPILSGPSGFSNTGETPKDTGLFTADLFGGKNTLIFIGIAASVYFMFFKKGK